MAIYTCCVNVCVCVCVLFQVLRNIILAEDLVEDAEGEGERRRKEIDEAFRNVQLAVEAIEEASELTMQALEVKIM